MNAKCKILILILTLNSLIGLRGQTLVIENQIGFKYRLSHYLDSIGFSKKDNKSIDFDFRIWHDNYTTGQTKLIRLIKLKNGNWFVRSLDYCCYNDLHCDLSNFIIDTLSVSNSWDSTWKTILDEGLLNLPKQEDINKKLKTANGELLMVSDGRGYCFEIGTKKAKRRFIYNNVDSYDDFYKKHGIISEDYKKVLRLISLIDNEFDWTFKVKGMN
jgi:hypothetical protein